MTTPVVAQTRAEVTPVGRDAPSDPRILIASALLLSTVGMVAAWVPAQRAARLEPRVAMQDGH